MDSVHHIHVPAHWVSESVSPDTGNLDKSLTELNRAMRKFLINTSLRQAAFLGNAMQETQWLSLMREGNPNNQKYYPWCGRGLLQLTWPENYVQYWRFRGRRVDDALAGTLRQAAITANTTGSNATLIAAESHVPLVMQRWRDDVAINKFDAADSAGAYWSWSRAASNADRPPVMRRETEPVGNTQKPYYSCESFGLVAATVNVGHPSMAFSHINGLQARYQAYTSALVVLTDKLEFPDATGTPQPSPDW